MIFCENKIGKVLIDDEFNRVVDVYDFNNYPQLSYEYKIENSKVVLKSLDEISVKRRYT